MENNLGETTASTDAVNAEQQPEKTYNDPNLNYALELYRPYGCQFCKQRFLNKKTLFGHEKWRHGVKCKPGKMFLGGLKPGLSDDVIRTHFEQFGTIIEFEMPYDKTKNKRKDFGFITFEREETMTELIKKGKEMIGEFSIDLKKAKAKSGKMFLGGLKPDLSDHDIRTHFEQFGTIIKFEMPYDNTKKQRKGFGFITFEREETMTELIKNGKEMIGKFSIDLKKAMPKPAKPAKPEKEEMALDGLEPSYDLRAKLGKQDKRGKRDRSLSEEKRYFFFLFAYFLRLSNICFLSRSVKKPKFEHTTREPLPHQTIKNIINIRNMHGSINYQ